ncbi:MAG: glycosyltransferase, partial [Planctomycetota bacterium]
MRKGVNILIGITRLSLGGAGKFVVQLAKGLKKNGFDVVVLCGVEEKSYLLEDELCEEGIPILFVETLRRDVSIVEDIRSLIAITKLLKIKRFDIIHAHTTKAGVILKLAAFISGYKTVIYNPHGHIYDKMANLPGINSIYKRIIFFIIEKFVNYITKSKIICVSSKEYKDILNMGYSSKMNTYLVPNGIVIDEETSPTRYSDDIKNILVIGRLSPEKGQDIAIETLRILHLSSKNFKLT